MYWPKMKHFLYSHFLLFWWERLGYVCNPRSLKEGTETSRRMTDELGSRQRDLSTSSVTKRANGHWHAIIASSCRWSQREYKRQPVHRINHVFAEEPSWRPGRPAVVQQLWRRDVTSPFPPSGNEGYIRNRDVPFQSVTPSHVGWPTNWDPYQSATGAAPSSALCRPPDPSYKADDRTGLHREGRLLLSLEQPKQYDLNNTGKVCPSTWKRHTAESPPPRGG